MATLADRTIEALRANQDILTGVVPGLGDDRLTGPSGASEWTIAQVLSHLGSGAEITLATLDAATGASGPRAADANQLVWDRWNAMSPAEQAGGFLAADARLVAALESLTAEQRGSLTVDMGFLPAPLSVAGFTAMRLNEAVQHSWDVRVALDPTAVLPDDAATLLAEHLSGELSFLLGFVGKPDALGSPATVAIKDSGFAIVIDDAVRLTSGTSDATAVFDGPLEAAMRMIAGRLGADHTPQGVAVSGSVSLDELRSVFPGF